MLIGKQTFQGKANLVTERAARERIFAMIARKYWYAFPFIWTLRWLERSGFTKDRNAPFRVQVESADQAASSNSSTRGEWDDQAF